VTEQSAGSNRRILPTNGTEFNIAKIRAEPSSLMLAENRTESNSKWENSFPISDSKIFAVLFASDEFSDHKDVFEDSVLG